MWDPASILGAIFFTVVSLFITFQFGLVLGNIAFLLLMLLGMAVDRKKGEWGYDIERKDTKRSGEDKTCTTVSGEETPEAPSGRKPPLP